MAMPVTIMELNMVAETGCNFDKHYDSQNERKIA